MELWIDCGVLFYVQLSALCMEPTKFTVKEGSDFLDTKLMTRLTYTLADISGKLTVGSDGSVAFKEEDGIDYAPVTVQLPGGERVPFLFTVKVRERPICLLSSDHEIHYWRIAAVAYYVHWI